MPVVLKCDVLGNPSMHLKLKIVWIGSEGLTLKNIKTMDYWLRCIFSVESFMELSIPSAKMENFHLWI